MTDSLPFAGRRIVLLAAPLYEDIEGLGPPPERRAEVAA